MAVVEMVEIERRWLLADSVNMKKLSLTDGWEQSNITQVYLERHTKGSERIRLRVRLGEVTNENEYTHTIKEPLEVGQLEKEEVISEARFNELMSRINLKHQVIMKTRYVKKIGDLKFEVDEFIHPFAAKILEVEVASLDDEVIIPDCLGKTIEVTGDKSISNFNLSLKPKAAKKKIKKYLDDFKESGRLQASRPAT